MVWVNSGLTIGDWFPQSGLQYWCSHRDASSGDAKNKQTCLCTEPFRKLWLPWKLTRVLVLHSIHTYNFNRHDEKKKNQTTWEWGDVKLGEMRGCWKSLLHYVCAAWRKEGSLLLPIMHKTFWKPAQNHEAAQNTQGTHNVEYKN